MSYPADQVPDANARRCSSAHRVTHGPIAGGRGPTVWGIASILPVLTLVLGACQPQRPTTTYEPTIIGVIEESNAGYDETIPLSTGEDVDIRGAEPIGSAPTGGSLFLGGERDGELWFQIAPEGNSECPFGIASNAWNDGDFVLLESGLRLRKADTFTGEPVAGGDGPHVLCIDATGQALKTN